MPIEMVVEHELVGLHLDRRGKILVAIDPAIRVIVLVGQQNHRLTQVFTQGKRLPGLFLRLPVILLFFAAIQCFVIVIDK